MMETQAAVVDTETTGIDAPEVIEFSIAAVTALPGPVFEMANQVVHRFKPSKSITLGAMATHHIIPDDLDDCPSAPESFELPKFIIGHNVDYDWQAMGSPADVKRICTLALAREAWPDIDSHSLGALTYHLRPHREARDLLKMAHSAAADVALCFHVFREAIKVLTAAEPLTSWNAIWRLSEAARIPKVMPFGKHKGVKIADLPRDYIDWYRRQGTPDPHLIQAFKNAGLIRS